MKNKKKIYLRLNLISLFFVAVSFISVTLAWFVYSGLSTVSTEIAVKAWYIELEKDGKQTTNDVVVSIDEIYPGMETIEEEIKIKNLGDSDAKVNYSIESVRILGSEENNFVINETTTSDFVEDKISHDYPFHINIDLSKKFILAKTDESTFKVSISWPLDSGAIEESYWGSDNFDSYWGNEAYKFRLEEQNKKINDESYQIRSSIKLKIKLTAEQYLETDEESDIKYRLGNEILLNVSNSKRCEVESDTCIRTNVIDVSNTIGDEYVTLLPRVSNTYNTDEDKSFNNINTIYEKITMGWNVQSRIIKASDILNIVSKDIKESVIVIPNISDRVIGDLRKEQRYNDILQNVALSEGYFKFLNKFSYFYSTNCFWLNDEYNQNKAYAASILDDNSMKIYGEDKSTNCKVIPIIIVKKEVLEAKDE